LLKLIIGWKKHPRKTNLILVEAAAWRNLMADFGSLEEVNQLAVDVDLLDAAC